MDVVDLRAPGEVLRIARRLESAGFETWAVGGAVRDALRGADPGDWDLATAARPAEVRRLFRRTVPIGIEHGTVGVLGKDGKMYEVTTFRRDVETDGRRARVVFADTLAEDLERRDFTINAVAWHPLRRELRDPHGGVADLERGVLRTVGDPSERFAEDRLRVLRALRFAGRFGLEVAPETWRELAASAGELGALSPERIREELYKVLGGQQRPSETLRLYERSGVLAALYPELEACVGFPAESAADLWLLQLAVVDEIPRPRVVLRLAGLLHLVGVPLTAGSETGTVAVRPPDPDAVPRRRRAAAPASTAAPRVKSTREGTPEKRTGGEAEPTVDISPQSAAGAAIVWQMMRRLRASNADADRVAHLVAQHAALPAAEAPAPELRRWLRRVGVGFRNDVLRLRIAITRARGGEGAPELRALISRLRRIAREGPPLAVADLAIGGSELRAAGVPPGPLYGEILRDLLERVTDDPSLNTRERLVQIVAEELEGGR